MKSINILVVEDDPTIALEVEMIISEMGYRYLGNLQSSIQVIEKIKLEEPDLIIMDIIINGETDGITLAETIKSRNIPIIFITAIEDPNYFERVQRISYAAYLVKPFHPLTLKGAIQKALKDTGKIPNHLEDEKGLLLKNGNRFYKILLNEINWIKVDGNYCYFFTAEKKFVLKLSLKRVLDKINKEHMFLKIHRNYAIHKNAITNFNSKDSTIFVSEVNIPVGRKYREKVMTILKEKLS